LRTTEPRGRDQTISTLDKHADPKETVAQFFHAYKNENETNTPVKNEIAYSDNK